MDSRWINLKCCGLVVMLAAGWSSLACAQASSGQAIQFSSPDGNDDATASPSLTPKAAPLPDFTGAPQSSTVFNFSPPGATEALPRPQIFPPSQQARDLAEQKKNWVLMTPAEILGVKQPDDLLGVTERDAAGQEKHSTPLERYWERQNAARMGSTNGYQPDDGLGRMNFSDAQNSQAPANTRDLPTTRTLDSKSIWSKLLNNTPGDDANGQGEGGAWQRLLGAASPLPTATTPTPNQMADMERFRQLLGSSVPAASAPNPGRTFYSSPGATVDPILGEIKINPAGASYTPLSSGIGMPKGVSPLPGITTLNRASAATPAMFPQTQPWVMNGPELSTPPQRKF